MPRSWRGGGRLEGANLRSGRRKERTQPYEFSTPPAPQATAEAPTRKKWEDLDPEGSHPCHRSRSHGCGGTEGIEEAQ